MNHISLFVTLSFLALASACGGGASERPAATAAGSSTSAPAHEDLSDAHAQCITAMQRARECTNLYIPALVDVRIALDMPTGIAQHAQDEGRDAIVAAAHEEWKTDSTDPNIASACTAISQNMPPDQLGDVTETSQTCVAHDSCAEYVDCIMPLHEHMFKLAAGQAGEAP